MSLASLAHMRRGAYRLFSQSLLYPEDRRLEGLADVGAEVSRDSATWAMFPFFREWSRFLRTLEGLRYRQAAAIQGEYVSSFLVSRAGVPCPIYESTYLGEDSVDTGWLLAQLEGEYAEVGLSPSPALSEPPDHAAVELEFMSFLCQREAGAWEGEDLPLALRECQRQRAFLRHHLAWWLPELAWKVSTRHRSNVFAAATAAAQAFLVHDRDFLRALVQRYQGVSVTP